MKRKKEQIQKDGKSLFEIIKKYGQTLFKI